MQLPKAFRKIADLGLLPARKINDMRLRKRQRKERRLLALKNSYETIKNEKLAKLKPPEQNPNWISDFQLAKKQAEKQAIARTQTAQTMREMRAAKMLSGGGSGMFLARSPFMEWLRKATDKGGIGEGTAYLKEMGLYGVLSHSFLRFFAARKPVHARRAAVITVIEGLHSAKSKVFRRAVYATARLLHDNYRNRGTAIYDPMLEREVYEAFARFAATNKDFRRIYNVEGERTRVGQDYFRYFLRENMLKNFKFLKTIQGKPDFRVKLDAIEYCLVGGKVHPEEVNDETMIRYINDIFQPGNEVSALDKYQSYKQHDSENAAKISSGQAGRKLTKDVERNAKIALIDVQWKAKSKHKIDNREADNYFRRACQYYGLDPKEVHQYAWELCSGLGATKREDFSDPARTMLVRARDRAAEVYGFRVPQRASEPRKPKKEKPKIILPSGFGTGAVRESKKY